MIFPQKLDMHGRSEFKELQGYINDMQSLIEANDSNLRKKLANLESLFETEIGGIASGEATTEDNLASLAARVTDLEDALEAAGPILIEQPANQSVPAHTAVTFTVRALGALTYKWQHLYSSTWTNCNWSGNDTPSMTVSATSVTNLMNGRNFRCVITGGGWTIYTRQAVLTVT